MAEITIENVNDTVVGTSSDDLLIYDQGGNGSAPGAAPTGLDVDGGDGVDTVDFVSADDGALLSAGAPFNATYNSSTGVATFATGNTFTSVERVIFENGTLDLTDPAAIAGQEFIDQATNRVVANDDPSITINRVSEISVITPSGTNTFNVTELPEDGDSVALPGGTVTTADGFWDYTSIDGQSLAQGGVQLPQGTFAVDTSGNLVFTPNNAFRESLAAGTSSTFTVDVGLAEDSDATNATSTTMTITVEANDFTAGADSQPGFDATGGLADALAGDDFVSGSAGDDIIFGNSGNDQIFAGPDDGDDSVVNGDDIFLGGDGDDTLGGGVGADTLIGDSNPASMMALMAGANGVPEVGDAADDGNDLIFGGDGDDTIHSGNYDNTGTGSDTVWAGAGKDQVNGDAGDDILGGGDGGDSLFGNGGNDTIYAGGDDGVDDVNGGDGDDLLFAGGGNDSVVSGGAGKDTIFGGDGDDAVTGGVGNDELFGGADDDDLDGGQGDDIVRGGSGDDLLVGGEGADLIEGGDGDDVIGFEDTGASTPESENGADTINGGAGNDTINAGENSDVLNGGAGDDVLTGGGDADVFEFAPGDGNDVITDFTSGDGDQIDLSAHGIADLSGVTAVAYEVTTGGGTSTFIDLGDNVIEVQGMALADWAAGDFIFA